jgi:predicted nucleic acid-binding protein
LTADVLRAALDTNVLVYSEALELTSADAPKVEASRRLITALIREGEPVIAVQALAELHRVLIRKGGVTASEAQSAVERLSRIGEIVPSTETLLYDALELAALHRLQIFDSLIVAAAAEARCDILLSEDLQDGFAWRGVSVTNPFGLRPDRRVSQLLQAG